MIKIKSLSIILILLICTLFILGISTKESLGQVAVEKNTGDPNQEERLVLLLQIMENASQNIQNRIAELKGNGVIITNSTQEKAENGFQKAQDALLENKTGNFEGSIKDALEAMDDFKGSLNNIETSAKNATINDTENAAENSLALSSRIERTKDLENELENLAEIKEARGQNASEIRNAINKTNEHLVLIENYLSEGKVTETKNEVDNITVEMQNLSTNELNNIIKDDKPNRTKVFLAEAAERVDNLKEQFNNLTIPVDARQTILESLNNSLTRIKEAQNLIEIGNVSSSINRLEDGVNDEKKALDKATESVPEIGKDLNTIRDLEQSIDKLSGNLARIKVNLKKGEANANVTLIQSKITEAKNILKNASLTLGKNPKETERLTKLVDTLKSEIVIDLNNLENVVKNQAPINGNSKQQNINVGHSGSQGNGSK